MWKNSNLMESLYIIIYQWGQWCTHKHKCCGIGPVLPWGYAPWNKNVIKLVNLVICEKTSGIVVPMVAFWNVPYLFRHYLGFQYSICMIS